MKIKDLLHLDPEMEIVLWDGGAEGDSEAVERFQAVGHDGSFIDPREPKMLVLILEER